LFCEECGQTVAEEALPLRCGISPQEMIVVLLSGSGLKATDKILQLRANPPAWGGGRQNKTAGRIMAWRFYCV